MSQNLEKALHTISPRYTLPKTPLSSLLIHGGVALFWFLLLINAFVGHGIAAWTIGIVYIVYDTALLVFTFIETYPLRHFLPPPLFLGGRPSMTVIIAAYNEAAVLEETILALSRQSEPPEQIIIADDGSTDGTEDLLRQKLGLACPELNHISAHASLRWLRAGHGGKAATLNLTLPHIETDLMVTVDADTILKNDALQAMRDGFQTCPELVAATGVFAPSCSKTLGGRFFECFQTYEYIRNFLGRYAWSQKNSLLLISGAFAGFRRDAVLTVGGFDPDCLVEDYEIIHRLRRYGYDHNLGWQSTVLGNAGAITSAPSTILGFLRQRRRWFGGFLQTHYWYRDMVGAKRYHQLGMIMLPIKAIDTFQPIYGLCAFLVLLWYIAAGKITVIVPIFFIICGKIVIDLCFHIWSIRLYRRWTGGQTKARLSLAILASILEPFSFQLLRHTGACWGWINFLTKKQSWGTQKRLPRTSS